MKLKLLCLALLLATGGSLFAQTLVPIVGGVVTIDASVSRSFRIVVNATVTGVTINNPSPGETLALTFIENSVGGFTVTFGGNIVNACTVTTTASTATACQLTYDAGNNTWNGVGGGGAAQVFPGAGSPDSNGSGYNPSRPFTGGGTNVVICTPSSPLAGDLWAFNNSGVCVNKTPGVAGRTQATTSDTISFTSGTGDRGALESETNAALVTIALPQAGTGTAVSNPYTRVWCPGAAGCKLTSTVSTINGIAGATGIPWPGNTWGDCMAPDNANWTCTAARIVKAGTNITEVLNADGSVTLNGTGGTGISYYLINGGYSNSITWTGTIYLPPWVSGGSQTQSNAKGTLAGAGTVSGFYIHLNLNIAAATSIVFTIEKNGLATAVTCTVAASTQDCNDTTHSFTFVAGDQFDISAVSTGSPGGTLYSSSIKVTP